MLSDPNQCSGCGACTVACPKNCITMTTDQEGFRYPVVDEVQCIHCGVCRKVCPIENYPPLSKHTTAFAVQNAHETVRRYSSSGGVFSALAELIFEQGGWVCAAVYDNQFGVRHELTDSAKQLPPMRGAKYAQSCAEHCFPQIRDLLNRKVPVLFVGTPCQCAGLRSYLKQDYSQLLLVDTICHGVPSPKVLKRYLQERQQSDAPNGKLLHVDMRDKSTGWSRYNYSVVLEYDNGVCKSHPQREDSFMRGFVSNLYLRPSCSSCTSKGLERCSDMTIGDYWGIWDQHPAFDDDKGTSVLLVHTNRGKQAWTQLEAGFRVCTVSCKDAINQNPSALKSAVPHPNRKRFFKYLERHISVSKWIEDCLAPKQKSMLRRWLGRF